MFTTRWWNPGKTVSDEGYSVTLTSRTTLLYQIDGQLLIVATEGAGKYIDIFHSSMSHWKGDPVPIDGATDERNVDNITRALESRGLNVRVVT